MKLKIKLAIGGAIVSLAAGTVVLVNYFQAVPLPEQPATTAQPGPRMVRYAKDAPQLSSLKVEPVQAFALPVADPVNGHIAYDENVTARISSPLTGRVVRLLREVGDQVKAGDPLVVIDSADLASAEADWQKSRADTERKKLALERAQNLIEREVIARKDFESAQADYQQALAESRRSAQKMRLLNASGHENGRFVLKAPISGIVADRQVNPGMEVRPDLQNPLFVVTDISRLWLVADVPERYIADLRPGQMVSVQTDAYPQSQFPAIVEKIGIALDPTTRRVQVRCRIKNMDMRLRPEMYARITFLADGSKKAIRVANSALVSEGLYNYAFVEAQPGQFERRRVNIVLKGPDVSFVDSGIADGEKVVVRGALLLNAEASSNAQ
ncbi:efflux RND transporter periplasmic adaptor subunit [Lacisediminimonas sp.]|uniref:efflux RND transporter periplasmic adaptor subunit n=1 Tax=Lacisediminimonas sp. TaxID=3060582 RepID=UPI002724BD1F|nr:efflux RND transporter periplasmic adaptor subunit [Lacisediminimonas sp.]MDO8299191.1 efflux RND transporter periplasmic adaptor subunit [Lacisediminimonas sp.]